LAGWGGSLAMGLDPAQRRADASFDAGHLSQEVLAAHTAARWKREGARAANSPVKHKGG